MRARRSARSGARSGTSACRSSSSWRSGVAPPGVPLGVVPVPLGVVFLANLELGSLFPPMGLNLFLSASRFGKPLPLLYRKALPFLIIMAIGVLLITYVPAITTGVVAAIKHE